MTAIITPTLTPTPSLPRQGDIILTHGTAITDRLIQFGECIHDGKVASKWNHAAYVIDDNGGTIQAIGKGVVRAPITAYKDYMIIPNPLDQRGTLLAIKFGLSTIGDPYGYATDVSIGIDILDPEVFHFKDGKSLICSELVVRCMEHGGLISPKLDTSQMMPSDIYEWLVPTSSNR